MTEKRQPENPFALSDAEKEVRLQALRARFGEAVRPPARPSPRRRWTNLRWWQYLLVLLMVLALLA